MKGRGGVEGRSGGKDWRGGVVEGRSGGKEEEEWRGGVEGRSRNKKGERQKEKRCEIQATV